MNTKSLSFLIILLLTLSLNGLSQSFRVAGHITDGSSKNKLAGTTVLIKNTRKGTISDSNGYFILEGIPDREIELEITFLGYKKEVFQLDLLKLSKNDLKISLYPINEDVSEVDIRAESKGNVKAMILQKEADNIKNVISAEQIKQFPDINAAEVMQRIPGITIQRDQGEGRYVQLRGTPPELSNFNVNGEQIPSPEGNVRYVGLDIIAADQIEFIEVTKVLTPDMDADGIAGNINIITKTATSEKPEISANLSGGYNNLMNNGNSLLQFSYGQLNQQLGIQLNAVSSITNQGSHNMEFDYTRGPVLDQANDTTGNENFHVLYSDIEYRHYSIQRRKTGLSGSIDFHPSKASHFYIRGMYNQYSDDETRRRVTHKLTDANTPLIYRSASMERDIRSRKKTQEISTLNLGGKQQLYGLMNLDYEFSYALASDGIPNFFSADFTQNLIGITIDKSNPEWPIVHFTEEEDSLNAHNFSSYNFGGLSLRENSVIDQNYTARVNLLIPYSSGKKHSGTIKTGGKIRLKEKTRDNTAWVFSKYAKINIYAQPFVPLALQNVTDDFSEMNLLNHDYEINMVPNSDSMHSFFIENRQHFKLDESSTWENTYQEDYQAYEDIYAAYLMARHSYEKLMILVGLRYELNRIEYTTQNAWLDLEIGSPTRGQLLRDDSTRTRTIPFILPQLQLKYQVNDKTNLRAAITKTYSRPSFESILPYRIINEDGDIKKGNPNLIFPSSLNIDLLHETFLAYNGILSGGLFFKKIDHFVFKFVRKAHEGTNFSLYGLKEITMPVNGIEAFVYGLELQSQFKLSFLNSFWKNFGFYGTYTLTESNAFISKRYPQNEKDIIYEFDDYNSSFFTNSNETEQIPLPGQARHTANASLFYQINPIYIKLSANYHSAFLSELGNDKELDVYYDQSFHLDFTANYQISKSLNAFVDVVNLTNAPLRYYLGSTDYFKQQEYYSWWGKIGIKINL
jgi:TonB-dependent receptor